MDPQRQKYLPFILTGLTFMILGFALYAPVLHGEFVSDDYTFIAENYAVRDIQNIQGLWRSLNTRFLVMLSFALNYHFHRLDVEGYHLVNILIHIFNSMLVYVWVLLTFHMPALRDHPLRDRAPSIAFYAGLIFLCHPIQTQAVSFITQRGTALACCFYLLTLIFYIKARLEQKFRFLPAAWLAMLCGIVSKESTFSIPLTLAGYEFYFGEGFRHRWKQNFRRIVPFVILSGLLVWIFLQERPESVVELKAQFAGRRFNGYYFLTEINVLRTYLRLLFLPVNQMHQYAYPLSKSFFEPATFGSFLLLAAMAATAVRLFGRFRLLSFTIFWFFVATSVEFMVVCVVNRGVLYEHWLYLPMVGFSLFAALLLHRLIANGRILRITLALLILALCVLTYMRNFVWQTEIGFWEDGVKKTPNSALVYLGSGTAYQRQGLDVRAWNQYRKGLQLFSAKIRDLEESDRIYLSRIYNNLGLIFEKRGMTNQAIRAYQRSYKFYPTNASPYHNLAKISLDTGKYRQAIVFLKEEMRLVNNDPNVYYGLGLAFLGIREKEKARVFFHKAARMQRAYGNADLADRIDLLVEKLK